MKIKSFNPYHDLSSKYKIKYIFEGCAPLASMTYDEAWEIVRQELQDWEDPQPAKLFKLLETKETDTKIPQYLEWICGNGSFLLYRTAVRDHAERMLLEKVISKGRPEIISKDAIKHLMYVFALRTRFSSKMCRRFYIEDLNKEILKTTEIERPKEELICAFWHDDYFDAEATKLSVEERKELSEFVQYFADCVVNKVPFNPEF